MDAYVEKQPTCTPQQATVYTQAILNMMVKDMRPLSMVDGEGFKEMIEKFNSEYVLPSRTHFTKLMEEKYMATFQKVSL